MFLKQIVIHNFRGIIDTSILLQNYSLIVGANNAGKTTIFDALRAFYEKDGFKFSKKDHFPLKGYADEESWIELLFELTDAESLSLKEEYQHPKKELRVRKYFLSSNKKKEGLIFAYDSSDTLLDNSFYGAKNVQSGKFGDLIYIPAVSKVDDHAKLSGPSALRDLITNVMSSVVDSSDSYTRLNENVSAFADEITTIETDDNLSLKGFEDDLNDMLSPWQTNFKLKFTTPATAEIIKSMLSYDIQDINHETSHNIEYFGSGFQRHFIYSLINLKSKYAPNKVSEKSKDFKPNCTILLFEEPEAFLHPPQQNYLAKKLMNLNKSEGWQVICSTHSSHFVSKSTDKIPAIIRAQRESGVVKTFQINHETWESLVDSNQVINNIVQKYAKTKNTLQQDDLKPDMEVIKYFLWLNSDRSSMFFANYVLLVEGPSETCLFSKLVDDGKLNLPYGTYILDTMGKYNIHRFMTLLGFLGIKHSVIYDDDSEKEQHIEINKLINDSKNNFTVTVQKIEQDLEAYLSLPDSGRRDRKPQHILFHYSANQINEEKLNNLCSLVESCFPNHTEKVDKPN